MTRRAVWLRAKSGTPIREAIAAVFAEMAAEETGLPPGEGSAVDKPHRVSAIEATATDGLTDHAKYIADGGCPWMDGKTWCNDRAGHGGDHWARYLEPDGKTRRVNFGRHARREAE